MSVQPGLNNSNMVVAEIINEINSTQPLDNYSQNTRSTPIQQIQRAPQQQRVAPPQQQPHRNSHSNSTRTQRNNSIHENHNEISTSGFLHEICTKYEDL